LASFKDALSQARQILDSKGVSNSKLDSLILLSHTLFCSKEQVIFNPDFELNEQQEKDFFKAVNRRAAREPVSHIIGKREFFGQDFLVSKDVLDPRPDSEILIELVFENFLDKQQKLKILELGVGSGCLIITLLCAYKNAEGDGVDISDEALKICQKNAEKLQVKNRLNIFQSDLFEKIKSQKFDLIISNPPYIAKDEIEKLQDEVRLYEPRTALDGGVDGLDFYRRIAIAAKNFLAQNGKIILEIGIGQKEKIVEIFAKEGFLLNAIKLDLSGIERALCFEKKLK
jgi:release factor glutamine methyltransferase